jgi:hypothetical protein
MHEGRVDISILQPFTQDQIEGYVSFLRKNGEPWLAEAVKAEVEKQSGFMLRDDERHTALQHCALNSYAHIEG